MWKRTKSHHHWDNNAEWFNISSIIIIKGLIIARRNYCSLPWEACVCLDAVHFLRRHETIHNKNWILASFVDGNAPRYLALLSVHLSPEWISVSNFRGYSVDSFTIYCRHFDKKKAIWLSLTLILTTHKFNHCILLFQGIFNVIAIVRNVWQRTTRAPSTKMRAHAFLIFWITGKFPTLSRDAYRPSQYYLYFILSGIIRFKFPGRKKTYVVMRLEAQGLRDLFGCVVKWTCATSLRIQYSVSDLEKRFQEKHVN